MRRAAAVAADAKFLKGQPTTSYAAPPFTYSVAVTGAGLEYSVAQGSQKLSRKLDWVMGAGDLGHTFLYQVDGRWYQSLATFYLDRAQLDITTGLTRDPGSDLEAALGVKLSAEDARKCFGCHTVHATTSQGFNPRHAEAGVGCEACHGPAGAHAANAKTAVFDPAKLSPSDSNDFCGACHRSAGDVAAFSNDVVAASTALVRFQPYRLEESKCWRATQDARLTCVACHDPHQPLNRNLVSYDKKCLQCHTSGLEHAARVCPRASSGCVQCHMPKVNVASMHGDFTDHFIRIARAGEGFPP
jgi:predicted CXXCH cytochrome family protein